VFFSFNDAEPAVVCDFSLFVLGSINIVNRDWSGKFLSSDSQSFPHAFVDKVVRGSTIDES
jgi:hypothetical protein